MMIRIKEREITRDRSHQRLLSGFELSLLFHTLWGLLKIHRWIRSDPSPKKLKVYWTRRAANRCFKYSVARAVGEESTEYHGNTVGHLPLIWTCGGTGQVLWGTWQWGYLQNDCRAQLLWTMSLAVDRNLSTKTLRSWDFFSSESGNLV